MSEVPPPPPQQQPGFSNYPRTTQSASSPYQRPPGIYFDNIGVAWKLVQSNFAVWVPTLLLTGMLMYAIILPINFGLNILIYGSFMGPATPSIGATAFSMVLGLVPAFITNVISAGLLFMGLKVARNEQIGIGDMFGGFRRFGSVAIGMFLMTLLIYLGFICFLIPGFFVAGALAFVPLLILDRNMSPIEAISTSFDTLKSQAFPMFGLLFVSTILSILGVCLCGVGALFTGPIYIVTIGLTYNNFFPPTYGSAFGQPIGVEPPR